MEPLTSAVVVGLMINALSWAAKTGTPYLWNSAKAFWKDKNLENTMNMTTEDLKNRGADSEDKVRQPTMKFAVQLVENAAVEDQPELQKVWAKLLANAMDKNFDANQLHPSYFAIIGTMTPLDIKLLNAIYSFFLENNAWGDVVKMANTVFAKDNICPCLPMSENEYEMSYRNLVRVACITSECSTLNSPAKIGNFPVAFSLGRERFYLTLFGYNFINACIA